MQTTLKTAPTIEPLTLQEVKDHLRVDSTDEDSYVEPLITVVREHAETFTERALITQTWEMRFDRFPPWGKWQELNHPPLQSITTIKYIDVDGVLQTLDSSIYTVDITAQKGRFTLAYDQTWPVLRTVPNAITIEFVAGYGGNAEDIPMGIRHGMMMLLAHLYEHRETTLVGVSITSVPKSYDYLLTPYRAMRFA